MDVRDGMNRVVVSIGPAHTLREAARRMTRADVGAAVVTDPEAGGPGIITERDLLHACGSDQDLDTELVRDHLTQRLIYAAADWPLEQAAEEMVRGRFRHVIVLDGSEVVGIIRCATSCAAGRRRARPAPEPLIGGAGAQGFDRVRLACRRVPSASAERVSCRRCAASSAG
jgi:signal-transduction protein with cAMP-binding, CBS, and nucleotidyltransferase domain